MDRSPITEWHLFEIILGFVSIAGCCGGYFLGRLRPGWFFQSLALLLLSLTVFQNWQVLRMYDFEISVRRLVFEAFKMFLAMGLLGYSSGAFVSRLPFTRKPPSIAQIAVDVFVALLVASAGLFALNHLSF